MIPAGVGRDKVLVWEYIGGRNWNGTMAVEMYKGPILNDLRAAQPRKRKFRTLEDNDPAGFKCRNVVDAQKVSGTEAFKIPKRSLGLNMCDCALWSEVALIAWAWLRSPSLRYGWG